MTQHQEGTTSTAVYTTISREFTEDQRTAFQSLFKVARMLHGWSQSDVAKRAGISQPVVHEIELGPRDGTSLTRVLKVARVLGIEPTDIAISLGLYISDNPEHTPVTVTPTFDPEMVPYVKKIQQLSTNRKKAIMSIINHYLKVEGV